MNINNIYIGMIINNEIRIPSKQPVFQWNVSRGFWLVKVAQHVIFFIATNDSTWMSQEVSKWSGSVDYDPSISHLYVGYNPFTNHLLTSWDIQAGVVLLPSKYHENLLCRCSGTVLRGLASSQNMWGTSTRVAWGSCDAQKPGPCLGGEEKHVCISHRIHVWNTYVHLP